MELLEFYLLRLIGAVFIPFTLFVIITTARRPAVFERYSWGTVALGVLALTWLLNGYLNQNTQLLVFMYPLFFGFCALLGPAYYYSLIGHRPQNLATTIMHASPAVFIFTSALISSAKYPLTQQDYTVLFTEAGNISSLAWSLLGDQFLSIILLPIHFGAYATAALMKTHDRKQFILTIPLFIQTCIFAWVFSRPGTTSWNLHFYVAINEILLLILFIHYLMSDSPRIQYERKKKLHIEPVEYGDIVTFLANTEISQQIFAQPKINVDQLSHLTNIEAMRWKNYLSDENMSFADLKKKFRIEYAQRLIEQGFLEKYTVDSLSETIGYSSRTSFYSAYKAVTGGPWQRKVP